MKKVISVTLSLLLFVTMFTFCAGALNERYGDYKYTVLEDGTVKISKYLGEDEVVLVPEKIAGRYVVTIGAYSFINSNIKEVVIPKTVKDIRYRAFKNCQNLEKVTLNEGLEKIMSEAFFICKALKSISVPDSVKLINSRAFYGCKALEEIKLGKNLERVSYGVFVKTAYEKNENNWYEDVLYVDSCAAYFKNKSSRKIEELKIKDGTTIVAGSFINYEKNAEPIKKLVLPDSLKYIGDNAFNNMESLETVEFGKSLVGIGVNSFYGCSSIKKIKLPEGTKKVGESAFKNCFNLTDITIPASVEKIGNTAFGYQSVDNKYYKVLIEGVAINGYANTAAEEYAEKNEITFNCQNPKTPKAKITKKGKNIKVKCSNLVGADGIQVRYTVGKKTYTKTYNSKLTTEKTLSNLKAGKYKVKVRAFTNRDGEKLYSKWTKAKTVKIK